MHKQIKYVWILCTLLALTACQGLVPQPLSSKTLVPAADGSLVETAEAAASISHSMEDLAAAARGKQGMLKRESGEKPPEALTRLLSIDWAGPVEPLVKQLGSATTYRVKVLGAMPTIPPMVSLHKRDTMAYDILEDLRAQVYPKADIVVFPVSGVIELRYL